MSAMKNGFETLRYGACATPNSRLTQFRVVTLIAESGIKGEVIGKRDSLTYAFERTPVFCSSLWRRGEGEILLSQALH
jgi:hypothetical protein